MMLEHSGRRHLIARRSLQLAFVLFVVGMVLTLLTLQSQQQAVADAIWHDPTGSIRGEKIAPDLAALRLAGVSDAEVLALAVEVTELETVRALLVLSGDLTDQQRMNGWLWLAQRYHQAGQMPQAVQAYRMVGTGAVNSEDLPNLLRVETLLTAGQQLVPLHDTASARYYLQQAAVIGARAPNLTANHRRTLLDRIVPALLQAGGRREDWEDLAQTVKTEQAAGGTIAPDRSPQGPVWAATPPEDAAVVEARNRRIAAAAAWLAAEAPWYSRADEAGPDAGDATTPAQARAALRQALLAEDKAVAQFALRYENDTASQPAAQELVLRWLLLKRGIAWGGAGARLVPDWEAHREEIDATLAAAWRDWLMLQSQAPYGQVSPDFAYLPAHIARRALSAAYWGLFPEAPVAALLPALRPSSAVGHLQLTILEPGNPPVLGWSR